MGSRNSPSRISDPQPNSIMVVLEIIFKINFGKSLIFQAHLFFHTSFPYGIFQGRSNRLKYFWEFYLIQIQSRFTKKIFSLQILPEVHGNAPTMALFPPLEAMVKKATKIATFDDWFFFTWTLEKGFFFLSLPQFRLETDSVFYSFFISLSTSATVAFD